MARNPKAEVSITAESRTLAGKLREARAQFTKFGGALKKEVFGKVLFDGPKASAHMAGQLGAMGISRGLGFFEEQARGVFHFNAALRNFQLAARRTPEEAQDVGNAARRIAEETGLASEVVLAGEKAFIDLAGAENYSIASMRTLARTARASNTEIGAMATVMYSLQNALHIKPEEIENTLSGLINQSKDGTIHFANMAEEIIAVAPKFARFGVTGRQGAIELGAMFQVVRSGFKDGSETATGLEGIFKGLIRNASRFKAAHVNVFNVGKDGVKHLKPIQEIFAQIEKSKLIKDPSKMIKAFGRGEGEAAFRLLFEQKKKFDELVEAGRVNGTVQQDLATVTESAGGRIDIAMERMKNGIAAAFTPERIERFVNLIEGLPDKVSAIADALGAVGDALGAFYHLGQAVRGAISGNNNPFAKGAGEDLSNLNYYRTRGFDESRPEVVSARRQLEYDAAQRDAYNASVTDITGAEVNEKSTPASIERAVLSKYAGDEAHGGVGRQVAGDRYLRAAGVSDTEAQAMYAKMVAGGFKFIAPQIVEAIKQGFANAKTEVKADGKAIVDVHRGSSAHARRPGG